MIACGVGAGAACAPDGEGVALEGAEEAGAPSTSFFTIRPPGPVPAIVERSTPDCSAILRARGETRSREPSAAATGALVACGAGVKAAAGVATGVGSAGAAAGLALESLAGVSPLSSPRIPIAVPTAAFSPSPTRILVRMPSSKTVSYTHLTLPTIYSV